MNSIIEYVKTAREALQSYILNDRYDYKTCEKFYSYIKNIDHLDKDKQEELDKFIIENKPNIIHLADIYTNETTLKNQLTRMRPFTLGKPSGRIYKANGNFAQFKAQNIKQQIKIKTYPKKTV